MNDNFYGEDSFSLHQQMSDYIQKLEAEKKELIEQNKNLLDEITNGCHRCTENCSLSPMSEEYTRLEAEKKELIDFIEKVYDKVGTAWEYDKAFLEIIYKYNPDSKYFLKF
jgi:uncharacterized protein (UPF0335 family)